MRRLNRLWPAFESIPGWSGVLAEWRDWLGEEFPLAKSLLKSTGRKARGYPCPSPGGPGCPREVVEHRDGSFTAVCGDQEERNCDDLSLSLADVMVHALDHRRLAGLVAQALGIEADFEPVEGLHGCWRVGAYVPFAGRRFPAYMLLAFERAQRAEAVHRLCLSPDSPFLLVVPTATSLINEVALLLQHRGGRQVLLEEILVDGGNGQLAISQVASERMATFHAELFPEEEEAATSPAFPTPPNATWGDLRIRFLDGHRATLFCQGVTQTVSYSTMGMEDRRKREPTYQWTLLERLAEHHGRYDWQSSGATTRNIKRIQRLNQDLERYFGISGHPIQWRKDEKAYCALFEIHYEPDEPARPSSHRPSAKRR